MVTDVFLIRGFKLTELSHWLVGIGLEKYAHSFADAEIEFTDLTELSDDDLKELGLPLGHADAQ